MKSKTILLTSITLTFVLAYTVSLTQAQNKGKKAQSTKSDKSAPAKTSPRETTAFKDGWQTFSSKEGGFSVLLPVKPQVVKQEKPTKTQGILILTMYIASTNNGEIAYGASYEPQEIMNTEVEEYTFLTTMPENGGGRVVSLDDISVKGVPGIIYIKQMPNGSIQILKAYVSMSKRCLYQLMFTAPNKQIADAAVENIKKFFTSFKLL